MLAKSIDVLKQTITRWNDNYTLQLFTETALHCVTSELGFGGVILLSSSTDSSKNRCETKIMTNSTEYQGKNRRTTPRSQDRFYQIVLALNVLAWVIFVVSLVVFHYARPELISGVQEFWGMEGRNDWSDTLSIYLVGLLMLCTIMSFVVLLLRRKRNRRKQDYFGINVVILLAISLTVLVWITTEIIPLMQQ